MEGVIFAMLAGNVKTQTVSTGRLGGDREGATPLLHSRERSGVMRLRVLPWILRSEKRVGN